MKEQIIAILKESLSPIRNEEGCLTMAISESNIDFIADEIVKLFQCKNIIAKVKEANTFDKRSFEEAEANVKGQAWICPRCQKVHSWLSMTCDCPPNVITASTIESKEVTEIKGENNCDNCIWGICLTADWPCFDCDGSNKWEPIKTE